MTSTSQSEHTRSGEAPPTAAIGPVLPEMPPVFVMEFQRPQNDDPCFNAACRHPLGEHYITFDDKRSGCSRYTPGPRGGAGEHCRCDGFVIMPPQPFRRGGAR